MAKFSPRCTGVDIAILCMIFTILGICIVVTLDTPYQSVRMSVSNASSIVPLKQSLSKIIIQPSPYLMKTMITNAPTIKVTVAPSYASHHSQFMPIMFEPTKPIARRIPNKKTYELTPVRRPIKFIPEGYTFHEVNG